MYVCMNAYMYVRMCIGVYICLCHVSYISSDLRPLLRQLCNVTYTNVQNARVYNSVGVAVTILRVLLQDPEDELEGALQEGHTRREHSGTTMHMRIPILRPPPTHAPQQLSHRLLAYAGRAHCRFCGRPQTNGLNESQIALSDLLMRSTRQQKRALKIFCTIPSRPL